ncbi:MAG: ATP-dependent RNA helicase DeaD [Holosporales bacterium]
MLFFEKINQPFIRENIVPQNQLSFEAFNIPDTLVKNLKFMGFSTPTPIQEQAIPFALSGRDVLGSAQTGTGKTAAFAIPAIAHILNNPKSNALILTPTRELATQVLDQVKKIAGQLKVPTALLIGGDSYEKQMKQLRARPRIVVGTPGRINDHLDRKTLILSNTDFLVMDETDRMLDMGFMVQLEEILPKLATERQTLMFSATFSKEILKIAADFLTAPERISVGSTTEPTENIAQESIETTDSEKYALLTKLVTESEGSFIVFVKTKRDTEKLVDRLDIDGYQADAIHGDLKQARRDRVILKFRSKRIRILVATDVAARGLDIPHIECVVNYDLPHCPEDYIHRIGRTGRAGAKGLAVSFITNQDRNRWRNICRLLNPNFKDEKRFDEGSKNSRRRPKRRFDDAKSASRDDSRRAPRDHFKRDDSRGEGRSDFKRDDSRREGRSDFKRDASRSEGRSDFKRDDSRRDGRSDFKRDDSRREGRSDFKRDDSRKTESRNDSNRSPRSESFKNKESRVKKTFSKDRPSDSGRSHSKEKRFFEKGDARKRNSF